MSHNISYLKSLEFPFSIQVKTFEPETDIFTLKELETFREKILCQRSEKWVSNYSFRRLNFKESEAITIFLYEKKIVGFCTAWCRDFYPPKTARILNRFWLDRTARVTEGLKFFIKPHGILAVEHQCQILKRKGFDWAFISRPYGSEKWCESCGRVLNEKSTIKNWQVSSYHKVCSADVRECWQTLIFASLRKTTDRFELLRQQLSGEELHCKN